MIKACLRRPTFDPMRTAYRSFLPYILEQWWVNLDWMVLAELNGLGRTNPNIQKCMGTMKQVFSWLPLRTLCCKAAAAFQALVLPRSRDVVAAPEWRHPSSPACQSETLCLQKLNMDVLPNQSHLIAALPSFDWFDCKTFWVLIPCVFRSFGLILRTNGFEYSQTAGTIYTFELSQDPHMQIVGNCHMSMFRCTASTENVEFHEKEWSTK